MLWPRLLELLNCPKAVPTAANQTTATKPMIEPRGQLRVLLIRLILQSSCRMSTASLPTIRTRYRGFDSSRRRKPSPEG
ncbi:MAG: hypothetical protein D6741_00290 [Planctomycetota bacterium]|nr:MAG: hypothetical protein D6741_00290 [Planctomycetota bacterium]